MKNTRLHYLEEAVEFVADRQRKFSIDECKLAAEAMDLEKPNHPSDWSRVMNSAVRKRKIDKLEQWVLSKMNNANQVPRRLYRRAKGGNK